MLPILFAVSLAACSGQQSSQAPDTPTIPEVGVITVTAMPITLTKELPGRITPIRVAEVRPRVSGIIVERTFQQGSVVAAGSVLYSIDPAPFQVELDSARAALARAEAVLFQAARQEDRIKSLVAGNAASQAQYDLALANERQAEAEVAAQKAAVARAELNLDYTNVRAPISGRIGRALVTEGALVSQTAHLATIQQLDPIYADFTQSVAELNKLRRDLAAGRVEGVSEEANVRLVLDDGALYSQTGRLLFSEISVDPTTAKVTLRGEFPNPKAELLPGMYVRVVIEEGILTNGIAIPTQAIQRNNAGGSEVYVINDQGRSVLQPVRTSRTMGTNTLIEDGLRPGYRVVVDGFQRITPGGAVTAVPWPGANVGAQRPVAN
jgi:membrane fusion protein (multidrug efflux system)